MEWARTEIVVTVVTKVSPRACLAGETADLRQEEHQHAITQRCIASTDVKDNYSLLSNSGYCAEQCIGFTLLPSV